MQNFQTGLVITVVGMALVFLTLIIVMVAIWLLDRIFRPSPEVSMSTSAAAGPPAPSGGGPSWANEAAAIAVAIVSERRRSQSSPARAGLTGDLSGDVVAVIRIDPGHGTWRGYGRLQAME